MNNNDFNVSTSDVVLCKNVSIRKYEVSTLKYVSLFGGIKACIATRWKFNHNSTHGSAVDTISRIINIHLAKYYISVELER